MRKDQEGGLQDLAILVVEDEPPARKELVRLLVRRGFPVREAGEAAGALEEARHGEIGVALMDIRLGPGPDGIETAKIIQERQPWISVVFVSAYVGDLAVREEARLSQVRVASWIEKPVAVVQLDGFLKLIARELQKARVRKRVYEGGHLGTVARDILETDAPEELETIIKEIMTELELLKPEP